MTQHGCTLLVVDLVVVCPILLYLCHWSGKASLSNEALRRSPLTEALQPDPPAVAAWDSQAAPPPEAPTATLDSHASAPPRPLPPPSTPESPPAAPEPEAAPPSPPADAPPFAAPDPGGAGSPRPEPPAPPAADDACDKLRKAPSFYHGLRRNASTWRELDAVYALNGTVAEQGFIPGDSSRMAYVLQKLQRREAVHVVAYGGSFVQGSNCKETEKDGDDQCAWPYRVERWWESVLPESPAVFSNKAWSGVSARTFLNSIGPILAELKREPPDLVLLDFTVNSALQMRSTEVGAVVEMLFRVLLEHLPRTQLIWFEDGCPKCKAVARESKRVAKHYGVPIIDYDGIVEKFNKASPGGPDRFWPMMEPPYKGPYLVKGTSYPDFVPGMWVFAGVCCGDVHPPWAVHQYYADMVGFALLRMFDDACAGNLPKPVDLPALANLSSQAELKRVNPVCIEPRAIYDARAPEASAGASLPPPQIAPPGGWALEEDRPGRPGWIANASGSSIRFRVRFGPQATLVFTYLRSYEHVGSVKMTLHPVGSEELANSRTHQMVNALWDKNFSVPYSFLMFDGWNELVAGLLTEQQRMKMRRDIAAGLDAYDEYELQVKKVSGDKFKIISIVSC